MKDGSATHHLTGYQKCYNISNVQKYSEKDEAEQMQKNLEEKSGSAELNLCAKF